MKHTRKPAHIRLHSIGRIPLLLKELRCGIRFRTPRKLKEFENLPEHRVSSHPKAGIEAGKILFGSVGIAVRRLGWRNRESSHCHPLRRASRMTCSGSKNRDDLAQFCTFLLQHVVMTNLNFSENRFASLS